MRFAAILIATLLVGSPSLTANAGSVLVQTIAPRQGSLPDVVAAYGTAGPALDSTMTISLQSQGRISRFLVTAGEAVHAGQPLLEFAVSQAALGSYRQAETALATAKIDRARVQQLLRQQLATKDQLTQADKVIADAQSTLDTLTRSGGDKANMTIKAPFDGIVATIPVAQGDTLTPGAPMMTLMKADGLVVTVGIEPSQRFRVCRGNPVQLEPLTTGEGTGKGTVARVDGQLNAKTRLIDADVVTRAKLLPGAAFFAKIVVGHFDGIVVPRDAVLSDMQGAYVFQIADGKARRVGVAIAGSDGAESVVTGQIDPVAKIVVQGNYQLVDGMDVRLDSTPRTAVAK